MKDFYYIVHATRGDNVGTLSAVDKEAALTTLKNTFAPTYDGKEHANVTVEIIDQETYETSQKRIAAERKAEAESNEPMVGE